MIAFDTLPVGLFFGSFNPIHNGHLGIAHRILAEKYCREIWFVVSPCNPFKDEASLLPEDVRYSIVQAAIADFPAMKACDVEFDMPLRIDFPVIDGSTVQRRKMIRGCGVEDMSLEMKIEVSNEVTIPMIRVVANPCTGPEPNTKSTIPVIIVVS